jgi:hypothetical protein
MEQDPEMTEVTFTLRFQTSQLPLILPTLARISALTTVEGQLDLGFATEVDRALLSKRVAVNDLRRFYDEEFRDPTPSALPTTTFREIGHVILGAEKITDRKGNALEIHRRPWDSVVEGILGIRKKGLITWGPGSKKLKLLSQFQESLPPAEAA